MTTKKPGAKSLRGNSRGPSRKRDAKLREPAPASAKEDPGNRPSEAKARRLEAEAAAPSAPPKKVPRAHKRAVGSPEVEPGAGSGLPERRPSKSFPVVGIGASAGGLEAFTAFLKALPPDTGMAFVLVQHMDPSHVSLLNQLLERDTAMPVLQVKNGMAVDPNSVYVIPPNTEMTIEKGRLRLVARPGGALRHTPIDSFLSALAEDQQGLAIGVILSGIGSDGTKGLQAIKAQGGISFAQDEGSAKYPGMPQSALAAGCVDLVLPPDKIARELARMRRHPYLELAQQPETVELSPGEDGHLRKIFRMMRTAMGVDFTHYKQRTIQRRISRRMLVRRCETLANYVKYIEEHPDEVRSLFQDVLIHVTSFFREREVFQSLQSRVFPRIIPNLAPADFMRVWVPGCSSGEEVYSIAIALQEYLGETASQTGVQVFGTDVSDPNIQKARTGIYTDAAVEGVSAERLRRFFLKMEGGYQVSKALREMCIFARHDLTRDPPFSRMDLISCRNVLIYLTPVLQRRVLEYLHYALKPDGFLILGKSEGASAAASLFSLEDRKASIYSRIATAPARDFRLGEPERGPLAPPLRPRQALPFDLRKEADRIVLERYAPPALVVDAEMRVINFQGDTGPFLRPAAGEASFDILKLVRPELVLETRLAIQEAKKQGAPSRRESIPYKRNGDVYRIDVEAVPISGRTPKGVDFLVLFQNPRPEIVGKGVPAMRRKSAASAAGKEAERLKQQLATSQDHLRALMEDQEAAAEELRAANEEILSSNEELQSTNEELQTAKEELQSSNEELSTLNEELQHRNMELTQTAVDLNSLLNATEMPLVILGTNRTIRRFTPMAERLLNLIPTDVGRPISQIRSNLNNADLDQMAAEVLERKAAVECEVQDQKGHWYALRLRPYQNAENHVEGILVVLVDIHDLKQYSAAIVETVRGCLLVLDSHFQVLLASPGFYKTFAVEPGETEGRLLWDLGNGQWNILQLRELLENVLPKQKEVIDFEVEHGFPDIGRKIMLLNARELQQAEMWSRKILLVIEDITERREAEEKIHQLLGRVMTAAEDEGKRIARELHDSFSTRLAAVALQVSDVASGLASRPDLAQKHEAIREEIKELAKATHDLSHALHPAALSQLGLEAVLDAECIAFSKMHGIKVSFSATRVPRSLPDEAASCCYRVAQASLENVRQHAKARTASVRLTKTDSELVMLIEDSGQGFDLKAAARGGGLGLVSMGERVRLAHGKLTVCSKPGEGTQVEVRVPLPRA